MARRSTAQVSLFPHSGKGRHDIVADADSAAYGRALLAEMRGEALSEEQELMLQRARASAHADRRAPTPVTEVSDTLLTLDRGDNAEVRVSWRRYKGSSPFIDVRRWERLPGDVEMRPTRQGVTIRAREITQMLTVIVQAARRLSSEGDA